MTINLAPTLVDGPIPSGPQGDFGLYPSGDWVAGEYDANSVVRRFNCLFRAKVTTSETPVFQFDGTVSSASDWELFLDGRGTELAGEAVVAARDARDAAVEAQGAAEAAAGIATDAKDAAEVSATAADTSAGDAAASLADFVSKFLGTFSSDPVVVGGGSFPNGASYFNSLSGKWRVYWTTLGAFKNIDQDAQDAATSALASLLSAQTIAAGLSASTYTLDGIDAQRVGALMSFPKGLFMLDGARVALSSLLSFSSGPKYTRGPDGNYVLNAANGPAWDWDPATGRRRLLIEAIGATNYWANSEDADVWFAGSGSYTKTPNGLKGTLTRTNIVSGNTGDPVAAQGAVVPNGQPFTVKFIVKKGTLAVPCIGLYESGSVFTADDADCSAEVLSGPGTLVRSAGAAFWRIVGATDDTEIRVTRIARGAWNMLGLVYDFDSADAPIAGKTFSMGRVSIEIGYGSSYIASDASPTARAADIVTGSSGLLALLTAANATLALRGTIQQGAGITLGSNNLGNALLFMSSVAQVFNNAGNVLSQSTGSTPNFGHAVTYGSLRKQAINGSAVVSDAYSLFTASDTGIGLGRNPTNGITENFLLDELIVWPIAASDAGLQAQARVYS